MTSVPRQSSYPMIPIADALHIIAQQLQPLPPQRTPLSSAHGLILAQDVHAPHPIPAFRASIKDGYALRYSSNANASHIPVIGEMVAGASSLPCIQEGEAMYVTTGAPIPEGADCVVMVEHTERADEKCIRVLRWPKCVGADIRAIGTDVQKGELVLKRGVRVAAAELGILAACGIGSVETVRRVVVGVLSSGDELVDVDEVGSVVKGGDMAVGSVVDSNRPMLLACLREFLPFCGAVDLGVVRDSYDGVKDGIVGALEKCDMVITSGGVSMGKRDVIKGVLEEIGVVHFGRVIMKPGKPLTFATVGEKGVIGLPGNPVSAFVCFHLAVAVAAKTMAGWGKKAMGDMVEVRLGEELGCDEERPEYHRAMIEVGVSCKRVCVEACEASICCWQAELLTIVWCFVCTVGRREGVCGMVDGKAGELQIAVGQICECAADVAEKKGVGVGRGCRKSVCAFQMKAGVMGKVWVRGMCRGTECVGEC